METRLIKVRLARDDCVFSFFLFFLFFRFVRWLVSRHEIVKLCVSCESETRGGFSEHDRDK